MFKLVRGVDRMKRVIPILFTLILFGCGKEKVIEKKETLKEVSVITLHTQTINNLKSYNGTINPSKEVILKTPTGGYVSKIYKKNGNKIKKGEILVKLNDAETESALNETEGSVDKAKANYEKAAKLHKKYSELYDKQYISEAEYLNIDNELNESAGELRMAKAERTKAEDNYNRLSIRSTMNGIVTDLEIKEDEKLEAKTAVATIVDNREMELKIAVEGKDMKNIKIGKEAEVEIDELGEKRIGKVSEINYSANKDSKKYEVKLIIPNKDGSLIKGMYGKVEMEQEGVSGFFVPKKAIMVKDMYSYVAIIKNGKANIYKVEQGISRGDLQQIKSDKLVDGDKLVIEGQYLLNNNDKVKVKK